MTKRPPVTGWGRWPRTVGYLCLAAAGLVALVHPASSVREATSPTSGWLVYAWAVMILIGGLSSAVGTWLDRWIGEYVGLWPLMATLAVYVVAAAAASGAGALFLASFALMFLARWRHVAMVRDQAQHIRRQIARAGDGG